MSKGVQAGLILNCGPGKAAMWPEENLTNKKQITKCISIHLKARLN